ncbi:hypothetical protein F8568_011135 [Actinomadura sp. LD22]|uniref:Uncharacterized protein n=1 Tax=Actinomadura physcomitrii TaxID=2650748 RepID=A0A6I4MA22_9ACTN|nr:hypothetical protein [Actinomadura physcomitrii]MWA00927.1 hypothetical protein [Actinomadura physcomitrii]
MVRQDTLSRACMLDHPPVAYLLPVPGPDGIADCEVGWDDLGRDAAWTQERLQAHGLAQGHHAVVSFSGHEGAWFQPVIEALRNLGVVYGSVETMGWDHVRTRVFQRELDLHAILGLSGETLEALSGQSMIGDFFGETPVVMARPDGIAKLRDAGVSAAVISTLGPALAIECPERAGAHVNRAEWTVTERDGRLSVTASAERAVGGREFLLETAGTVRADPCACGSDDPRVMFT